MPNIFQTRYTTIIFVDAFQIVSNKKAWPKRIMRLKKTKSKKNTCNLSTTNESDETIDNYDVNSKLKLIVKIAG